MRKLFAIVTLCLLGLTACDGTPGSTGTNPPGVSDDGITVSLTSPKDGATDVPASAEITYAVEGASGAEVTLTDEAGRTVDGAMRPDGSSWLPANQLDFGTKYTVSVAAAKPDGSKLETKGTFTTMQQPANLVDVHSFIGDDQVVGVAMPIVIQFGLNVPEDQRDDVERRLFVRSDPPQEGIWHWFTGEEIHYRPREYWKAGTKLDIRIGTGGLPWGVPTWYGRHDLTVRASVGPQLIMEVDNRTKKMTVKRDGRVLRTMLVSLGKPSTPSSSGALVVMSRDSKYRFDTRREIPNGYVVDVRYAMRLTWQGEFVHAAPWSDGARGRRNISHGCVNLGTADARWLYDNIRVGDPVTIRGTEVHIGWGNGWTDWDRSWEEYVKGSALA
jgi:lipoprotein-anchoring transpeptidase ErfK/SrfK